MLRRTISIFLFFTLTHLSVSNTYAQSSEYDGYDSLSIRKVHDSDKMWRRTIWLRVDMREKINKPFFSTNREISRIIIDAVERGDLVPYWPDSTGYEYDSAVNIMTGDDFRYQFRDFSQEQVQCFTDENGCNDSGCPGEAFFEPCAEATIDYLDAKEYSVFRLREQWYFDKKHSRYYFDTQVVTMIFPGYSERNMDGADIPIASFRFKELHNVFKNIVPNDAIWFNEYNSAQHKNMADAFLLRLFSGRITKFSNIENKNVLEFYDVGGPDGLMKSQEFLRKLMEWEANLWEY